MAFRRNPNLVARFVPVDESGYYDCHPNDYLIRITPAVAEKQPTGE